MKNAKYRPQATLTALTVPMAALARTQTRAAWYSLRKQRKSVVRQRCVQRNVLAEEANSSSHLICGVLESEPTGTSRIMRETTLAVS